MKKMLKMGAAALSLSLLLSACGTSSSATGETATGETATETETETETYYAYNYDVEKLVTLGDYKGLSYTITDTTVTDAEVEADIESTLQSSATVEQIKDRDVENGDTVNVAYTGTVVGETEPFDQNESADFTIGSGSSIDGFEEGIIGATPGEAFTLNLTFPDEYTPKPELAGKDATFEITVNYIAGDSVVPELNDEFVAGLAIDNVTNVAEYREYVLNNLETTKKSDAESAKQTELFSEAYENATINDCPQELVAQYEASYKDYYNQYASYFGLELEEFLSTYMNTTLEDYETQAANYGKEVAGKELVIAAIAKAEGYEVTDDIYKEQITALAASNGFTDAETLENQYGEAYLKSIIINQAVVDILEKDAVGVEAAETETTETDAAETTVTETETAK